MARKPIPEKTEREGLTRSRRRCCVCWGLNRDLSIKSGQVAHLDGNPQNNIMGNLAFLCFEHHDQYDSQTSQSKGLKLSEVSHYRGELHKVVSRAWKEPVTIGDRPIRAAGDVSGHYTRESTNAEAEIEVRMLPGNRVHVTGMSLWGTKSEFGPNIGELDFEAPINDGRVVYLDSNNTGGTYKLELVLERDRLLANEANIGGRFGMNASFEGEYFRVGPKQ